MRQAPCVPARWPGDACGGDVYGYSPSRSRLLTIRTGKTVDSYPALTATGDLLIGSDEGDLYAGGP